MFDRFLNMPLPEDHGNTLTAYYLSQFHLRIFRDSLPELFLRKGVLKLCCKFTGEHPCDFPSHPVWFQESCKAAPAKQLYWNFTSAWVFSCKFAAYFRIPFIKNTSGQLFLNIECSTLVLISKNNCFIPNYKYRKLNLLLIIQPQIIQ